MRFLTFSIAVVLFFNIVSTQSAKDFGAKDFEKLMQKLAAGWNEGDARKAADCFAEDAIYTEPPPDFKIYKGRKELFEYFGGNEGRELQMKMTWHHLVFNKKTKIGAGEFTFEYGDSKVHGVAIVKIRDGKISNWREYWYESELDWEEFTKNNKF